METLLSSLFLLQRFCSGDAFTKMSFRVLSHENRITHSFEIYHNMGDKHAFGWINCPQKRQILDEFGGEKTSIWSQSPVPTRSVVLALPGWWYRSYYAIRSCRSFGREINTLTNIRNPWSCIGAALEARFRETKDVLDGKRRHNESPGGRCSKMAAGLLTVHRSKGR